MLEENCPGQNLPTGERSNAMFWSWLYSEGYELWVPVSKYLSHHISAVFRGLLLGGDLLFLLIFWLMQQHFAQQRIFDWWLAGFAATLAMLFVFAMGSARIHGYRPDQDFWIRLATGIMFVLCLVLIINTV
jgi:formate/nitrite transporter FocA (FNT family)